MEQLPKDSATDFPEGGASDGFGQHTDPNGVGTAKVAGGHTYGEKPSRILFVRNINSNDEHSDLRTIFEKYGEISTMDTSSKQKGFVTVSYYDIRHAFKAMHGLPNEDMRQGKLEVQYSYPKDDNEGTLVVSNIDARVSYDFLRQIFRTYGEVDEVWPVGRAPHKFIEFCDVRDAQAALRALNGCAIFDKLIKVEPSRRRGECPRTLWLKPLASRQN
ncbi:protein MEI2-like 5 [Rhodamnia argentea]|uniref:Protein MEI2-like 5 n=1 Tax=Rhodamnia argentea TaxID=178133 RepID=A0ABM3HAK3_9MYRT|nr:protein MEI2-like 5 [Rhodamnia argentea]XP_048133623.1 protein MEI2-like 5 [Rhodamnia argentea]